MQNLRDILNSNIKLLSDNPEYSYPEEPARLLNGRGLQIPGFQNINIDYFPPVIFATLYQEYSDDEIIRLAKGLSETIKNHSVVIQDRSKRPAAVRYTSGDVSDELIIKENGLRFYLHPLRGQNPGFFPDMRTGRKKIKEIISSMSAEGNEDISVLNLFAYTCSLSAAALAAGASSVINIDKNKRSLDIGQKNRELNRSAMPDGKNARVRYFPHDIFKSLGKLQKNGPYDLIIADPPPNQKGSFLIKKDYPRLIRRLPAMLKPGGLMMLTLNSPSWNWEDFENMINTGLSETDGFSSLHYRRIQPPPDFAPAEDGRGLKIIICSQNEGKIK